MSLRARLTLAGSGAVLVALALASLVIYLEVRSKLHDQIDLSLIQSAEGAESGWQLASGSRVIKVSPGTLPAVGKPDLSAIPGAWPQFDSDAAGFFQVVPDYRSAAVESRALSGSAAAGTVAVAPRPTKPRGAPAATAPKPPLGFFVRKGFVALALRDAAVADGQAPPYFRDVRFGGQAMRLYTMRLSSSSDGLVRTLRPLTEADATISRVRWLLLALTLGGAIAAGLLGRLAANAVLRPVRALAGTARDVSETRDLKRRIDVSGRDELASLAADFNAMLTVLEESQLAQQQLIADASHELRTPLTAHRANMELLARPDLPPEQRERILAAAVRTIEELSVLVSDLIQAARDGKSVDARELLTLDDVVDKAVDRAQRRAPALRFTRQLTPTVIAGARARLERAIDNVLDNAVKWSPDGGIIEVELADSCLGVRDHGPGIPAADLPHVCDRFYRAAAARALPGSGLGLAIVKQTVEDHGGSIDVSNADGGGTLVTLRFVAQHSH